MNIDFSKMKASDQLLAEKARADLEFSLSNRRAAYVAESDPLRMEADYDALILGLEPDYSAWLASVAAIKARFPLPVSSAALDA